MTFDLNKREYGEWFAPFEQELLFLKKEEHIGWVEYTSDNTFKLKLSPFYGEYRKYEYIVADPKTMPPQGKCIEVKPFKLIHDPLFNTKNLYGKYQNYCIIDRYNDYQIRLQKLHDETTEKWVAWDELKIKFAEKKWHVLEEIATELNNLGFIIHQHNFSQIRKVDILKSLFSFRFPL